MEDLLRRTLGERVDARRSRRSHDLWPARCDANQLESALLNLAINARDAMPDGGKLTIETRRISHSTAPTRAEPEPSSPGDYVVVSVSDTGVGMPDERDGARPSIRSSPPSRSARAPGSACPWSTASCASPAATSRSPANRARHDGEAYLPRLTGDRAAAGELARRRWSGRSGRQERACWSLRTTFMSRLMIGAVLADLGYRVIGGGGRERGA